MIDENTIAKIEAIDQRSWGTIYKELVRYANYKLNKAYFEIRTEKDSVDAEYFATLAIEKLITGERRWDFERFPDVTIHLIGIIKSLISSHFKSSTRSIVIAGTKIGDNNANEDEEGATDELLDDDIRTIEGPEEIMITCEKWAAIDTAFGLKRDDHAIFCEWLDGSPPKQIAEGFDIPVTEVNNAIKRGTRIVKILFNKQL
jgi:DNA-directed RNA polymerase specialized sigma24 family protein